MADGEAKLADAKTQLKESEENLQREETADKDIQKAESELEKAEVDVSKLTRPEILCLYTFRRCLEAKGSSMKTTAEGIYVGGEPLPIVLYAVGRT